MVLRRAARCSREFAATSATEIPSEKKNNGLYLFRDSSSIEPPAAAYEPDRRDKLDFNIYAEVATPKFILCPDDIWMPKMEDMAGISVHLTQIKCTEIELYVERLKRSTVRVLDHGATLFVVFVGTFWTLFAEDVAHGWPLDKTVDTPFAWASLFFLILFVAEQATRSIVQREDYLFSLFWWMELFANASMVLMLGPVLVPEGEHRCSVKFGLSALGVVAGSITIARVSRIARVLRLLRVFSAAREAANQAPRRRTVKQSAIGRALNDKLVQSMAVIVVALQLIFPLLSFEEKNSARELAFEILTMGGNVSKSEGTSYGAAMLERYQFAGHHELVLSTEQGLRYARSYATLLKIVFSSEAFVYINDQPAASYPGWDGNTYNAADCLNLNAEDTFAACPQAIHELRCSEIEFFHPEKGVHEAYWEVQELRMAQAQGSAAITILLLVAILVMFTSLSADVASMVVEPIEGMVKLVKALAENPSCKLEEQAKSKYETEAVRIALAKIVGLMQLGFGGAGHELISANLANSEQATLDLTLRGKKRDCAYGYCDIRQFTETVECLQDQVMLFTNAVGEIVHQSCYDNHGEPNKNIGDAFLIVWRSMLSTDYGKVVDGALTSFRRCVREIASSLTLQLVTDVEAIHNKFGRGVYQTKLGFGLHFGWSVEGPVGTTTKIDCSYLSPEVKISDRLEAATKIYSSNILMSGQFYDLLSDNIKVGVRLIDYVTLKHCKKPFRIYADDRSNLWLQMNARLVEIHGAEAAYELFSKTFHEGIDAFIKGDWPTAQQKLESARDFCPMDAPTLLLLKEMKTRSLDPVTPTAPLDWKGYHESEV
jgi:class 3 adenylate cyclase